MRRFGRPTSSVAYEVECNCDSYFKQFSVIVMRKWRAVVRGFALAILVSCFFFISLKTRGEVKHNVAPVNLPMCKGKTDVAPTPLPFPCVNAVFRLKRHRRKSRQGIPLILHQIYKDANLPDQYIQLLKGCQDLNKEFLHILWTDEDFDMFIKNKRPELVRLYRNYKSPDQKSDFMRLVILEHFGGVYFDLDVECRKPLVETIDALKATCILDRERELQSRLLWSTVISPMNSVMMATPRHKFIRYLLFKLNGSLHHENVLNRTGPHFLRRRLHEFNTMTHDKADYPLLVSPSLFSPIIDPMLLQRFKYWCTKERKKWKAVHLPACAEYKQQGYTQHESLTIEQADSTLVHRFMHLVYEFARGKIIRKLNACREVDRITRYQLDCFERVCMSDQ